MKRLTVCLQIILSFCASIYLTFVVDIYTLNTIPKRVFVFCYFMLICYVVLFLKQKFLHGKRLPRQGIVFAAILAVTILVIGHDVLLPHVQETTISLSATPCEDGTYREVWLTAAKLDGQSIKLSQLEVDRNQGWTYSEEFDDYVFYPESNMIRNYLEFSCVAKSIELTFATNPWSGEVQITQRQANSDVLALTDNASTNGTTLYSVDNAKSYSIAEYIVYNIGAMIILTFLMESLLRCLGNIFSTLQITKVKPSNRAKKYKNIFLILIPLVVTLAVCMLSPCLFYHGIDYTLTITSLEETNPSCQGYEMWVSPENAPEVIYKDFGWKQLDNGGYLCTVPNQSIAFRLNSATSSQIDISRHEYAGKILVQYFETSTEVDLYNTALLSDSILLDVPLQQRSFSICAFIVLAILCLSILLISFLLKVLPNVWNTIFFMTMLVTLVSFNVLLKASLPYYIFAAISAAAAIFLQYNQYAYIYKYLKRKVTIVLIIFVSIYSSFACFGYDLFLQADLIDLEAAKWVAFVCISILMVPIVLFALQAFERAAQRNKMQPHEDKKAVLVFQIQCFLIISSVLIAACVIFAPANMTSDNVDQWMQATGYVPINNAHPAIHTLFLKLCSSIYPSPMIATIVQAILFAYVSACIESVLYRKGCNKKILLCIAAVVGLLPNTIAMITCTSKNIFLGILMLWMIYLLIEMMDDCSGFFHRPCLMFQFAFIFPLLYLIRHNTFIFVPVIIILLIYYTIRFFKQVHLRPILCLLVAVIIMQSISGPMYDAFHVEKASPSIERAAMGPLVMPFISALKHKIFLPGDTMEYLRRILPIDEYERRYNPYHGDTFFQTQPTPDLSDVTIQEMLSQYLRLLVYRPDIVIKSRLDGVNLIWDVFSHPKVRHDRYALGIWGPEAYRSLYTAQPNVFIPERKVDDLTYQINDGAATYLMKYVSFFDNTLLINSLVWRNGIYVIFMFLSLIILTQRRSYKILILHLLPFLILCTLVLVISWQIYQYVWFFPISIVVIISYQFVCCCEAERQSNNT